jgi:hypothetical protein
MLKLGSEGKRAAMQNEASNICVAVDWDRELERIRKLGIEVFGRDEVRQYLASHEDLLDPLMTLAAAARERFRNGSQLFLEVFHDPDFDDVELTLCLRQSEYPQDIMPRIREVAKVVEEDLMNRSGYILFTTDFQSPR